MDKIERMQYLIEQLNIASDAYYGGKSEYISNYEWDQMFDELTKLEDKSGLVLPGSPTHDISRAKSDDLSVNSNDKETHEFPALSLAKTKSIEDLQLWAGDFSVWLSWKLDGLTLVLTYDEGYLTKILTRGNGYVGSNITYMKNAIKGFPLFIPYTRHLVVRGEALIKYSDFEYINNLLENDKYANPRNLASGTLALDATNISIVKERNVNFIAFTLVYIEDRLVSWGDRMDFLDNLGFTTVKRAKITSPDIPKIVEEWTTLVESGTVDTPVDGLVVCYDDTEYATGGNVTGHHATRAGFAFKWQDTVSITMLDHIEWSCAASVITPVAVFQPVQLEGTTVSRASLCNISEMERLGIGANKMTQLKIIKANKIIPKCIGVEYARGKYTIPTECPICGAKTEIVRSLDGSTKVLRCINEDCPAKNLRRFTRFVSRKGMDIDGLSIKTLLLLINHGFIRRYEDIYSISNYQNEICHLDGFGTKSCQNLIEAIERSRTVAPENFIYALGIPLIGEDAAKKIVKNIGFEEFCRRINQKQTFADINNIGAEKSNSIIKWFKNETNKSTFFQLLQILKINYIQTSPEGTKKCAGINFAITGNVFAFTNRLEFIKYVESEGGTVTSSISTKTNYLVNNDILSKSSKNEKAKKLGIPIISEQTFLSLFGKQDN